MFNRDLARKLTFRAARRWRELRPQLPDQAADLRVARDEANRELDRYPRRF